MVYKCNDCDGVWWSNECKRGYRDGEHEHLCPYCQSTVVPYVGEVENSILRSISIDGTASRNELIERTGHTEEAVRESVDHLLDMGYLAGAQGFEFRITGKGDEKLKE